MHPSVITYCRNRRQLWWRHQMETFFALLNLCVGKSPVTGEFLAQRPVARRFDVFFDLRLNERLGKQSWGWWFETSLWRHCNDLHWSFKLSGSPATTYIRARHDEPGGLSGSSPHALFVIYSIAYNLRKQHDIYINYVTASLRSIPYNTWLGIASVQWNGSSYNLYINNMPGQVDKIREIQKQK